MISLRELLKDPIYKKYFTTLPELPASAFKCSTPPWRVIYRDESGWKARNASSYREAFSVLKGSNFIDGAITCRRIQFDPPIRRVRLKGKFYMLPDGTKQQVVKDIVWKPKLPGDETWHNWCPYCRRPTVFSYYRKHHALKTSVELDPSVLRCAICGVSERIVTLR